MADRVFELIEAEEKRQRETLMLIPSENYASKAVRSAQGSVLSNKYAEGYPGKRYYQGNAVVDELERLCQDRAKKLFGVPYVNVQPLSGAPANLAIIKALKESNNDVQLSQHLSSGGHLTMGQEISVTAQVMKPAYYHLDNDGEIDWGGLERVAMEKKPRIIWSGGTGYTRIFNWERYAKIAEKVGAYFVADVSHIGGLIAGGVHPSPVAFANVIMTTTHKTLRGPRGAMILVTEKGLTKDPELGAKIDKAVFPGVQGGPHMENVAALAVALEEASRPEFKVYAKQIVLNAKALADELRERKYKLVGGGTQNHMVWVDLRDKEIDGWAVAWAMEYAGMIANKQAVPMEPGSPYYPSGLRLGTPAVTTRGMKEPEMKQIANWIDKVVLSTKYEVLREYKDIGSKDKEKDQKARKKFRLEMKNNPKMRTIAQEVRKLCSMHPIYLNPSES